MRHVAELAHAGDAGDDRLAVGEEARRRAAAPTPPGVPVAMRSPGSSVMIVGDVRRSRRRAEDQVRRVGLLHQLAVDLAGDLASGSANSSAVTSHGPTGVDVLERLALEPLQRAVLEVAHGDVVETV